MDEAFLSVLLCNLEYTLERVPGDLDSRATEFLGYKKDSILVPVIHVFGSSSTGQKAYVHVHGFHPYFYFRPLNPCDKSFEDTARLKSLCDNKELLARTLETAVQCVSPNRRFGSIIHGLEVVQRTNMYGYHPCAENFVKVTYYRPGDVKIL